MLAAETSPAELCAVFNFRRYCRQSSGRASDARAKSSGVRLIRLCLSFMDVSSLKNERTILTSEKRKDTFSFFKGNFFERIFFHFFYGYPILQRSILFSPLRAAYATSYLRTIDYTSRLDSSVMRYCDYDIVQICSTSKSERIHLRRSNLNLLQSLKCPLGM